MPKHPGFADWPRDSTEYPFPIGPFHHFSGDKRGIEARTEITFPPKPPAGKTAADGGIGSNYSGKLWFTLKCTTSANGKVSCEVVLRGQHNHAFPSHGEKEDGPPLEIRLKHADLTKNHGSGQREIFADHGKHCDRLLVEWSMSGGKLHLMVKVRHYMISAKEARKIPNVDLDLGADIDPDSDGAMVYPKESREGGDDPGDQPWHDEDVPELGDDDKPKPKKPKPKKPKPKKPKPKPPRPSGTGGYGSSGLSGDGNELGSEAHGDYSDAHGNPARPKPKQPKPKKPKPRRVGGNEE